MCLLLKSYFSKIWLCSVIVHNHEQCWHSSLVWRQNERDAMASQITSLTIVYSIVYSDTDQRKDQITAWLAFVRGIHQWPMISPHKGPVMRKMFSFDDVIMSRTDGCLMIIMEMPMHRKTVSYQNGSQYLLGWMDTCVILFCNQP